LSKEDGSQLSVEFVLNVLRQHENEFDRLLAELEHLVDSVTILVNKFQQIADGMEGDSAYKKDEHRKS
jgi:hypothetical protein